MNSDIPTTDASRSGAAAVPDSRIVLNPIGTVSNGIDEPQYIHWGEVESHITIVPDHREALNSLEQYSHLIVLFWMDQVCYSKPVHVPQGRYEAVPEVGMFACRCPYRPNPIGVTTVPIVRIEDAVITVRGLDAINGTPVVDIKPYTPQYDFVCDLDPEVRERLCRKVRIPDWVHRLTY